MTARAIRRVLGRAPQAPDAAYQRMLRWIEREGA
jgi:hypothetical protein